MAVKLEDNVYGALSGSKVRPGGCDPAGQLFSAHGRYPLFAPHPSYSTTTQENYMATMQSRIHSIGPLVKQAAAGSRGACGVCLLSLRTQLLLLLVRSWS